MLIVTTNDIPGYRVEAVLGEVMGMTVRAANIGANFVASFRAIGGEVNEYTKLVYDSRQQVMQRMWEQATQRGANAIIGCRFDTGEIAGPVLGGLLLRHRRGGRPDPGEPGATPQSISDARGRQQAQPQQQQY